MTLFQRFFYFLLLFFIAILSVSGTIALRNMVHLVLLGMFSWALIYADKRCVAKPADLWREVPWALRWWIVFLLLFPLWAIEGDMAWRQLLFHWSESILTWVLAFAAIAILGKKNLSLWALTWASAVPVFLHLTLLPLAMVGAFQNSFGPEDGLSVLWNTLLKLLLNPSSLNLQWTSVLRFYGIEPMHGNIGYPASQTIALALGCLLLARHKHRNAEIIAAWIIIALCLTSGLLVSSRGTVVFSLLILITAACIAWFSRANRINEQAWGMHASWQPRLVVLLAGLLLLALFLSVVRHDMRWQTMIDKLELGLSVDRPLDTLCNGLQDKDRERIRLMSMGRSETYENNLIAGLESQDGGRALLQRVSFELALNNPRGLDGSREAYEKLIFKKCGHPPKLKFSHAHNAWLNLALSVGWLGVGLFAWVFVSFAVRGWHAVRSGGPGVPQGFALLLLAVFWFLRGIGDAVYQEHYLQMQAIMLLSLGLLVSKESNGKILKLERE